jgi:hypothetical protein
MINMGMKTFAAELEAVLVRTMIDEGMFDFWKPKSAHPTKPKTMGTVPVKKAKPVKDSPHYRTNHHYGHGDIDPETVPVFKPGAWR